MTQNSSYVTITLVPSGTNINPTVTSPGVEVIGYSTVSIATVYEGTTPTATLTLEVSNDGVNYSTYTGSSFSVTDEGTFTHELTQVTTKFVRIKSVYTSGTGTLTSTLIGKYNC